MKLEQLREFRQLAYECLGNAKDATFELADAVMTTRHVSCLGDLALNPYGIPVGIGQGYSTIALIPSMSGSWALPLRHERITSWENPIGKGAQQLAQVCAYLQHRPIALFDSEYGCAPLVKATAAIAADKLMRVRSNRCLWSTPPAYSGRGRPKIHGQQLTLILVERLETITCRLNSQPLWLVWVGIQMPSLAEIWQLYLRRFTIEHWYRLAKQTLHWTVPKLSTPEQCERWSDLMPLLTWQLWLAKDVVREIRLPWQKSLPELTPGRVVQSMLPLLIRIGSPAVSPKRRGNSDGWQTGKPRTLRCRYPVVNKGKGRFQNSSKSII